ncbi:unnamed protein product [Acanthoscelides obtectus]|uniref:Cilia- and flagella-associated protein 52 n=1 Tax=Acanthoscelides obtectus TaxID=200917 RepID=A0A9P0K1M7_ACAOB|nr:unnamed protein product [Acanthoscelides obtectus]CAK1657073.1 Cilia- and flagella-associated protein 52 [Acanthoscelides obtectus]
MDEEADVQDLKIKNIIGFDGSTNNSLKVHPNGKHIIYPIGNKVAIQEWATKKQIFLSGHTNIISSIAVSKTGKYIASGQINHIGFKAMVIIWSFDKQCKISQYEHHKVRVEAVTFSNDEQYVFTIGGRDCGFVVVWDIQLGQVICGSQLARGVQGDATVLHAMNKRGACFITGGDGHLAVWKVDKEARNVTSVDVATSKLKRKVLCMDVNERDELCYCGTTSGDVLKIRLNFHHDPEILEPVKQPSVIGCWARLSRKKLPRGVVDLYECGVRSIRVLFTGKLLIGAGNGKLELVEESQPKVPDPYVKYPSVPGLKVLKSTHVKEAITSIQLLNEDTILAATELCEIFLIPFDKFEAALVFTGHTTTIHCIAFPHNFSEVFATASKNSVRIWESSSVQELLRICVQNFSCSSVAFAKDGKSILTGWSDGVIRSFTPLTGRLIYAILNAHNKGVSALAITSHGRNLVTGGCEGQIRLWEVTPFRQTLVCTLKEHRGPVSAIDINKWDNEAASASTDGTCIIWDLERKCRRQILFAKTLFMCVKYYPTAVQIITGGSDRKIAYWEVLDGSLVRELEGSPSGTINCLDISHDGDRILSGGNDQIVKLWKYQEGTATHIGVGHAAVITAARFSSDDKFLVTCDAAGGIFVWECPRDEQKVGKKQKDEKFVGEKPPSTRDEEDIRDLPSVRSQKSIDGVPQAKHPAGCECCRCSAESARSIGSGEDCCESVRSNSSQKSKKSHISQKSNQSQKSKQTQKSNQSQTSNPSLKSLPRSQHSKDSVSFKDKE